MKSFLTFSVHIIKTTVNNISLLIFVLPSSNAILIINFGDSVSNQQSTVYCPGRSWLQSVSVHLDANLNPGTITFYSHCVILAFITWDNIDNTIWYSESLIKSFSIANHLLHHFPWFAIVWGRQTKLFHLHKHHTPLKARHKVIH